MQDIYNVTKDSYTYNSLLKGRDTIWDQFILTFFQLIECTFPLFPLSLCSPTVGMEDNPLNPVTRNHAIPIIYVAKGDSKEKRGFGVDVRHKHFLEMCEHVRTVIIVLLLMANRRVFPEELETDCSKGDRSIDPNLKC